VGIFKQIFRPNRHCVRVLQSATTAIVKEFANSNAVGSATGASINWSPLNSARLWNRPRWNWACKRGEAKKQTAAVIINQLCGEQVLVKA